MHKIALLIPNNILCSAIAEQLRPQYQVAECKDFEAAVSENPDAVIAEAECLNGVALGDVAFLLFVIGGAAADNIIESFSKPLRLGHIVTRLQLHLSMQQQSKDAAVDIGSCKFFPRQKQIVKPDGGIVRLTDKEAALLAYLAQAVEPVPREELLAAVWGYDGRIDTHTLETHIYRLRSSPEMQSVPGWREFVLVKQGSYQLNPAWGKE